MRSLLLVTIAATVDLSAANHGICHICSVQGYICGGGCNCNPHDPTADCDNDDHIIECCEPGSPLGWPSCPQHGYSNTNGRRLGRLEDVELPRRLADINCGNVCTGSDFAAECTFDACDDVVTVSQRFHDPGSPSPPEAPCARSRPPAPPPSVRDELYI